MDVTILGLGAIVFLAHLFAIVFQKTRVPDVLLLIFVGLLLGPVLHVVEQRQLGETGEVLSAVALVTILFEGGTTLDLGVLGKALRPTLRLTVATFLATFLLAAYIGWGLLDLDPWAAATLGSIVGGTSSSVVIPLVRGLKLGEHTSTILILESALTDVLCIVLVFAVLGAWEQGSVAPLRVVGQIAAAMLFAALLGVLGGIAWMRALPVVRRIPDTNFATVAFVFIVYGVTQLLGFSGGIAALAFGVTLTNHERFTLVERLARTDAPVLATLRPVEQKFFGEIVFLLKTLFFLYLGISIRFVDLRMVGSAMLFVVLVYVARLQVTRLTGDREMSVRDAAVTSFMVPKGLAAAVLATVPLRAGLPGGELIRDLAFTVVFFSILLTAVMGWASERALLRGAYERVFEPFGATPVPTPVKGRS